MKGNMKYLSLESTTTDQQVNIHISDGFAVYFVRLKIMLNFIFIENLNKTNYVTLEIWFYSTCSYEKMAYMK